MHALRPLLVLPILIALSACVEPVEVEEPTPDAGDVDPLDPFAGTERVSGQVTLGPLFGASQARVGSEPTRILPQLEGRVVAARASGTSLPRIVPKRVRTAEDDVRDDFVIPSPLWRSNIIPGEVLVRRDPEARRIGPMRMPAGRQLELTSRPKPFPTIEHLRFRHSDGALLSEDETLALIEDLKREPDVLSASPNRWNTAAAAPNDPHYPLMWHYRAIHLEAAWELQPSAGNTSVAVVDTGVLFDHPDLANTFLQGADFVSDTSMSLDGDGRDMDPSDPGGDRLDGSSSWHGTHVGGTVSAIRNNGAGIAGVARVWHTPIRVLGKGGGTTADIIAGVAWAGRIANGGLPPIEYVPHVINMSLGGPGEANAEMQEVLDILHANKVLVVISAMNENDVAADYWPCNQQKVFCVGALSQGLRRASYSNYGSAVTLAAPGGELSEDLDGDGYADGVLSTINNGGYRFYQGTSMAAPHVAGVLAMMQSARQDAGLPLLNFEQARQILVSTATPIDCPKGCGAGLINAEAAVWAAKGNVETPPSPPRLEVPASSLRLTEDQTVNLQLSNTGGTAVRVTASFQSADGIRVDFPNGATVDLPPSTSRTLAVRVHRGFFGNGDYSGVLKLTPDSGATVNVPVDIYFGPPPGSDRPALVVFYAKNDQGEWVEAYKKVARYEDDHRFELEVEAGTYLVMASVDEDGNGWYFEEGERVGAWPLMEQPIELTVLKGYPLDGINFTLSSSSAP